METPKFNALAEAMENHNLTWKTQAKEAILSVVNLEKKAICLEIIDAFLRSSLELAKLFLLKKN